MAITTRYTVDGFEFTYTCGTGHWGGDGVVIRQDQVDSINSPEWFAALAKALAAYPYIHAYHYFDENASMLSQRYIDDEGASEELRLIALLESDDCPIELDDRIALVIAEVKEQIAKMQARKAKSFKRSVYARGFVYLIKSPTGAYKIGRTINPNDRLKTFGVKLPFEVEYVCVIATSDMYGLEKRLHQRFSEKRINGEWFNLDWTDVEYIKGLNS